MVTSKTVLIVEDEQPLREALRKKMISAGYAVITAENGQVGLALALKRRPDIILLDQLMPVMDGLTMLVKLRADVQGHAIPVIILTNLSSESEGVNDAMTLLEPSFYLVKSDWSLGAVVAKVKEVLAASKQTDEE